MLRYPHSEKLGAREGSSAPPTPRVFLAKSSELLEKKRVEFCESARKCKNVQQSSEECEKKGDSEQWVVVKVMIPTPPGICKDVKRKGLREGAFVSR
jgi:hypothetical protein